jgi:hypothetical protein
MGGGVHGYGLWRVVAIMAMVIGGYEQVGLSLRQVPETLETCMGAFKSLRTSRTSRGFYCSVIPNHLLNRRRLLVLEYAAQFEGLCERI